MKNGIVVIGAGWGDEGKGRVVSHFTQNQHVDMVVRFNGGAQAAHTVVKENKLRHVFGHFGSGTLDNVPTYLSSFFITNPLLFLKEKKQLNDKGITPTVYVDGNSQVTTICDMFVNQTVESFRADARHGSCGVGINETITRGLDTGLKLTVYSLLHDPDTALAMLDMIWNQYVSARLAALGVPDEYAKTAMSKLDGKKIVTQSGILFNHFLDHVEVVDSSILSTVDDVVFEGAQGLLLDEMHEWFPHVTRSRTGIINVSRLLENCSIFQCLDLIYVTRCYATRHGKGPFPRETKARPFSKIVDVTNIPNPHQGSLRFGYLDVDLLLETIAHDLKNLDIPAVTHVQLAITCLDQADEFIEVYYNDKLQKIRTAGFGSWMEAKFNMPVMLSTSDVTQPSMKRICNEPTIHL